MSGYAKIKYRICEHVGCTNPVWIGRPGHLTDKLCDEHARQAETKKFFDK